MDLDKKIAIKENLIAQVGSKEAERIWILAKENLKKIEERYPDISKGEMMHAEFIFPSAAIQLAVKEIKGDSEIGYKAISEHSWARSREKGAKLKKMAKIPGFKSFFVKLWDPITKKTFGPESDFKNVFYPKKKGEYKMDIVECPYNRYFGELGTPELTKIFCINDECMYGDIPGLEFTRHTTLGTGGDKCDFHIRVSK